MSAEGPSISYADLVALLSEMFDVPPEGEKALRARLKNLQAKNFPPGVNIGRRGRVAYGLPEIAKLALVLSLTSSFVGPDAAVTTISNSWEELANALRKGREGAGRPGAVARFRANTLADLGRDDAAAKAMSMDVRWPGDEPDPPSGPVIQIDLDELAGRMVRSLANLSADTPLDGRPFADL